MDLLTPVGMDGCTWYVGNIDLLHANTAVLRSCDKKIFGLDCGTFTGNLTLAFTQAADRVFTTRMDAYLTTLGLRTITILQGNLNIINLGAGNGADPEMPFNTVLLPSLRIVGNLRIQDVKPQAGMPNMFASPPFYELTDAISITIINTGMAGTGDYFGLLQCVAGSFAMVNNTKLEGFDGLNNLEAINWAAAPGPSFTLQNSPLIRLVYPLDNLGRAGGCRDWGGDHPPATQEILVQFQGCGDNFYFRTLTAYCDYLGRRPCRRPPPGPPPNPLPPPSPPSSYAH